MTAPCRFIVIALALGCPWLVVVEAQDEKNPPAKKDAKKKLTPEELREEVERKLPDGEEAGIFVFYAIERAFKSDPGADKKFAGVKIPQTTKAVHSMNDRKEAVEFLVKYLAEGQGGAVMIKRENGKNILFGDLDAALRTRRWEFVAAYPKTEEGEKEAAALVANLKRQLDAETKKEAKKAEERRKMWEDADKKFKKKPA
jgi:hypothetical protein